MPTFYPDDFDIDVDEFIDNCSSEEIEEMVKSLKERGFLNSINSEDMSVNDFFWSQTIEKLAQNRLSLTSEEEEVINKIASQFVL